MSARTLPHAARHHGGTALEGARWADLRRMIRRIPDAIRLRRQRKRQHEILVRLNDRLLEDIGLDRGDVIQADREPFWRL